MKRRMKRSISLVLSLVFAFSMLAGSTLAVNAADDNWELGFPGEFWEGYTAYLYLYNDKVDYNEDIISAKSSNTKVGRISKDIDVDTYIYNFECKRAGKTRLTIKFRTPDGEKKTLRKTITVKKYPYAFRSLKINGKNVNLSKNKFWYHGKTSKNKVSIKAQLGKGWKIRKIEARRYDKDWNESKVKVTRKMLSAGSLISFPKKYESMELSVSMYKGKSKIEYEISIERP